MPPKVAAKKPHGRRMEETPLHPYEEERLRNCMANNSRLQQLLAIKRMLPNINSISHAKNKPNYRNSEDSESEYDPSHDNDGEGDLFDDHSAKKGSKESNRRIAAMPPGGIKPRSKRVFAEQETTRVTRSKKSIAQPEASLTESNICVPPASVNHVSHAKEVVGNFDGHSNAGVEANGPTQLDVNTHMANGVDAIDWPDGHNQMGDESDNDLFQIDDRMSNGGEGITQPGGDIQMGTKGLNQRWERGLNMGHGLQRMNRARRGKLPIVIPERCIRPVVPLVAAKFATECNIIVRNHIPVLKRWKDYEDKPGLFTLFKRKLKAKFAINTSDPTVENACYQMMKKAVRQQRYRLKREHFDPYPLHLVRKTSPTPSMSDQQWNDLVECWKGPQKMDTCQKNKGNRGKVMFHQTTGSRSYMVHVENLGDKYTDQEPDALDLFKECHYSKKKKGYTSAVQLLL